MALSPQSLSAHAAHAFHTRQKEPILGGERSVVAQVVDAQHAELRTALTPLIDQTLLAV